MTYSGPQMSVFYPSWISFLNWCELLSLTLICCLQPKFVVLGRLYIVLVSTSAATVETSICLTLAFNSPNIVSFFKSIVSTELQLCTLLLLISGFWSLTIHLPTLLRLLQSKFPKWPILVGQLPSCVNIPRFILWVLKCLQRGNCCKKMNTWNLTLLSFIDSGWKDELFQMLLCNWVRY